MATRIEVAAADASAQSTFSEKDEPQYAPIRLNDIFGSRVRIRSGSKLGLVTGGKPTFTLEGRFTAGGQTYQTRSLKVRFVP